MSFQCSPDPKFINTQRELSYFSEDRRRDPAIPTTDNKGITMVTIAPHYHPRGRLRDVIPEAHLGFWPPGPKNGITDVPGVLVHTTTIRDESGHINTG